MSREKYLEEWKENQKRKEFLQTCERYRTDMFLAASQRREAVPRRMLGGRHLFITKQNSEVGTSSMSL